MLLTKVRHYITELREKLGIWCPPIPACIVIAGVEFVWDSRNVVRSVLLRPDAMLIPRFHKRGDLRAKDRDKHKQKNDTILQDIALIETMGLQILEVLLTQQELGKFNCYNQQCL
jgi:hypothetical protein